MNGSLLRRTSLLATLGLTSHAEFVAGVAAGLPLWRLHGVPVGLPLLLPVAIDCYVVDALERRRGLDRWAALGILALSVVGGSAYTAANGLGAAKAAGVGVVLVLVLSRLYATAKPSGETLAARDAAARERQAEDERERRRLEDASRLRVAEAEQLARIETHRVRALADAEARRLEAESAAQVARLAAASANRTPRPSANGTANRAANGTKPRSRTAAKASANASANPPARDHAIQLVASAVRDHQGPGDYVFDWAAWSRDHGGGKTFWWGVHKAATEPVHLAEAAS